MLTDVEGLYADWPASDEVISQIAAAELAELLPTLSGRHGAQDGGVPARGRGRGAAGARARRPGAHSLLLEIFTDEGIGTMVVPDDTERKCEHER